MSHLLSCSRSVGHCSLAAPNAVPAMPRPQLAKRSERLVMQAAPAGGATAIAPPAPATPQVSTAPLNTDLGNLSAAYSRQMKDAMGWGDRPYDYSYERQANAAVWLPAENVLQKMSTMSHYFASASAGVFTIMKSSPTCSAGASPGTRTMCKSCTRT